MKNALIIFARNPVIGNVKKRLAAEAGIDIAFEIYVKLLYHTYKCTKEISCEKFLYLTDFKDLDLFDENYRQELQSGKDLGEKMKNAFNDLLRSGFEKILLIGTDCPGLNADILNQAFDKLDEAEFVLGPAKDGGYYLLGLKENSETLFENINWSSNEVLKQTVEKIKKLNKNYYLLEVLSDIDNLSDLNETGFA
ncbi:MAG: TIGR04282 family arsenosugar biosynthesis glycosyltransferase [Ignavibacteria bacterium]|nr:TIGR04282 family arsenosugar biosynthesis glycosyltransferase [Ignavibacteria bacterium]